MPQLQTIIVILIVAGAAFYTIRRFYNSLKKGGSASCNGGCPGCDVSQSCQDLHSRKT